MICKTCHTPLIDFMTRAKCPSCDRKEIEEGLRNEEDRYNRLRKHNNYGQWTNYGVSNPPKVKNGSRS